MDFLSIRPLNALSRARLWSLFFPRSFHVIPFPLYKYHLPCNIGLSIRTSVSQLLAAVCLSMKLIA